MDDAVESFVEVGDDLTNVNSHAGVAIKLMKMRELVLGKEIRYLLFRASQSHLRVVSCFHPKRWREKLQNSSKNSSKYRKMIRPTPGQNRDKARRWCREDEGRFGRPYGQKESICNEIEQQRRVVKRKEKGQRSPKSETRSER